MKSFSFRVLHMKAPNWIKSKFLNKRFIVHLELGGICFVAFLASVTAFLDTGSRFVEILLSHFRSLTDVKLQNSVVTSTRVKKTTVPLVRESFNVVHITNRLHCSEMVLHCNLCRYRYLCSIISPGTSTWPLWPHLGKIILAAKLCYGMLLRE